MTEQEKKDALIADIKSQVEGVLNTRGVASKTEVDTLIAEAMKKVPESVPKTEVDAIRADLLKTAADLQKLKDEGLQQSSQNPKSVRAQVEDWMEKNKVAIESVKNGSRAELTPLNVRAAITMTEGTSMGASVFLPRSGAVQGAVNNLNRNKPKFWDYLPKGRTNLNPYVWVNKTNKQGNAAFIGEGVLKPLASFELATESSTPKKAAERMKASNELLFDVDGMTSLIEDELKYEVLRAANTAVLTGVASATNPKGITQYATAYTLLTIKTASPNNADAIRAAIGQLASLNFDQNIVAFINPIDAANMDLAKASTSGVYILPPFTTADGRVIAGVPVLEDNDVAVGSLLIGDISRYKVLIYQDFFTAWGWENDDFSKNLMTVIGEIRFHQYVSANNVGAFIYDTFANIKTALT
jgi:hypothetical protein